MNDRGSEFMQLIQQMSDSATAEALEVLDNEEVVFDFHEFEDGFRPVVFAKDDEGSTRVFHDAFQLVKDSLDMALATMREESPTGLAEDLPIERQHYYAGHRDAMLIIHGISRSLIDIRDARNISPQDFQR